MVNKTVVQELLHKPLWQLTGEEYVALHAYACTINMDGKAGKPAISQIKGVRPLAEYCSCSESQIYKLLREGVLDEAIISHIGKRIVFDGDKACELAQAFMLHRRKVMNNE